MEKKKVFRVSSLWKLSVDSNTIFLPGCTGALAREMAKAYPSSSVTVFDLPQVVETAQKHFCQEDDTVIFQEGELEEILWFENMLFFLLLK